MTDLYILDDLGRPMAVDDPIVWGAWLDSHHADRIVAQDVVEDRLFVSTVFLGLDHNFSAKGPPILYETMMFLHDGWKPTDWDGEYQMRYRTRAEAEKGHRAALGVAHRRLQEYDRRHT